MNGRQNDAASWIGMPAVKEGRKRQGIGTAALACAEAYIPSKGKTIVRIRTKEDNLTAYRCCQSRGYTALDMGSAQPGDGQKIGMYTVEKDLGGGRF